MDGGPWRVLSEKKARKFRLGASDPQKNQKARQNPKDEGNREFIPQLPFDTPHPKF
jgi:hypothetical protein